eukprot:97729_1
MDVIRPEGHKCDDNDSMSSTAMSSITAGTPGRADTITISNDEVIGNGKAKQSKKRKIECLDTVPIRIAKKAKTRPILRGGWGNLLNRQGDTAKTSKSKRKTKQKTLKGNKTKTNQQKQDAKTLKKGMAPRKDGKALKAKGSQRNELNEGKDKKTRRVRRSDAVLQQRNDSINTKHAKYVAFLKVKQLHNHESDECLIIWNETVECQQTKPTDKENKSDKMEVDEDDEDDDILQETEAIKPKTKTVKRMKCLLCCLFRDIANKNSARMAKVCAMAYEDGQVHDNRRIDKHFHPKEGVSHIAV